MEEKWGWGGGDQEMREGVVRGKMRRGVRVLLVLKTTACRFAQKQQE